MMLKIGNLKVTGRDRRMELFLTQQHQIIRASQGELVVKNPAGFFAGDVTDMGSIAESRRSPGGGLGNPLHYTCLEHPMDRGA